MASRIYYGVGGTPRLMANFYRRKESKSGTFDRISKHSLAPDVEIHESVDLSVVPVSD